MGLTRSNRKRFEYVNIAKIIQFVKQGRLDNSQVTFLSRQSQSNKCMMQNYSNNVNTVLKS